MNKIFSSAHTLLGIINDILDYSKIEAKQLKIESIPFNLEDVLHNLSNLVSLKAAEKELEFLFNIKPGTPYALIGDPLRLGQVLNNLTDNAIKFTDSGQVAVSITQMNTGSDFRDDECILQFTVTDTGIGMTQEKGVVSVLLPGSADRPGHRIKPVKVLSF